MAENAFTPGPWIAHPVQRWVSPAGDPEMPVCALRYESYGVECDEAEVRANARLIAAAPDLLEVAEEFLGTLDQLERNGPDLTCADGEFVAASSFHDRADNLRAAIAKARNHPKGSH